MAFMLGKHLVFIDSLQFISSSNNLYGWAMSQYLPTGGFKWLTEKKNKQNRLG